MIIKIVFNIKHFVFRIRNHTPFFHYTHRSMFGGTLQIHCVFTSDTEFRNERSRRIKILFRIETRFRFMYRPFYFFGDFSTYTFKFVNETSHNANNLYFGHNERRFHSEFQSRVNLDPSLQDPESTFHSERRTGMKHGMNSIRNELKLSSDSWKQI